ncbi:hypothetical protein TNCV_3091161 [Trichonephila clavipes]|uniref:Uncharacterized protein n=1 Tax=Trichonephila clavipes TaxID=2585209 RepID=A0A8X6W985_TRICX|nr:hypothetical protein TNCV_3091161 [Trichonephila clavipes]
MPAMVGYLNHWATAAHYLVEPEMFVRVQILLFVKEEIASVLSKVFEPTASLSSLDSRDGCGRLLYPRVTSGGVGEVGGSPSVKDNACCVNNADSNTQGRLKAWGQGLVHFGASSRSPFSLNKIIIRIISTGLGSNPGEDMDVCKCAVPLRHGGTLNSRRATSSLVRLVEGEMRWEATATPGYSPSKLG